MVKATPSVGSEEILKVDNLSIHFQTEESVLYAVRGISYTLHKGEVLALVGESGCGKSVSALSLLRLLPSNGHISSGRIMFQGQDILSLSTPQMRSIRGAHIGMIFQEPMAALNPVLRIGKQITEVLQLHKGMSRLEAMAEAENILKQVGISEAKKRLQNYPHELSGGMLQRVMIAMVLAGDPDLIIADEPTTALDVTIQAQILQILRHLQRKRGLSLLLITHDLGIVAEMASKVVVMYAGEIVEIGDVVQIFDYPSHPYTKGLFNSLPSLHHRHARLQGIPGSVPSLYAIPQSCTFANRCQYAQDKCGQQSPQLQKRNGHFVACFYPLS